MKCEHCGAHIKETDERCPYCNSYNEQTKTIKKPSHKENPEDVALFKKIIIATSSVVLFSIVMLIVIANI